MKEETQKGKKFIRGYSLHDDSPKVVLLTDEQLDHIANFYCNVVDCHKSITYADATFQLRPFFVLVTSYRNKTVYTKNSSPPVCPVLLGPIILCMLKDKTSYIMFFQKMTAHIPGLKVYLQADCTDGEKALCGALGQEFDRSVVFMCKNHENQNIKDKCSKIQISNALSKVIVDHIFNSEGLVHASTETEYWKKTRRTQEGWSEKTSYSSSYKVDEILHHVTATMSKEAGFDIEVQRNNVSESGSTEPSSRVV